MPERLPERLPESPPEPVPEPSPEPLEVDSTSHGQRDAASLRILGFFFTVLGTLVLVGTFWSLDNVRAIVVNVASGAVLVGVGVGMLVLSRRTGPRRTESSS